LFSHLGQGSLTVQTDQFFLRNHINSQNYTDTQNHNPDLHLQMYPAEGLCDACVNSRFVAFSTALSPACGPNQFPDRGILTSQWTTTVTLLWTNTFPPLIFYFKLQCFMFTCTIIFQCWMEQISSVSFTHIQVIYSCKCVNPTTIIWILETRKLAKMSAISFCLGVIPKIATRCNPHSIEKCKTHSPVTNQTFRSQFLFYH